MSPELPKRGGLPASTARPKSKSAPASSNPVRGLLANAARPVSKRDFLKTAGAGAAVAALGACGGGGTGRGAPIRWKLQTYAGAPLAEHVVKPMVDSFNAIANGEMVIELYTADELVPTAELLPAMQEGVLDAVQSDDDSMQSPADVSMFGGYFPFATRYSLDVPVLFNQYGLRRIWEEAYSLVENVTWLSAGAWDPCHFNTVEPIRRLADLDGLRVFTTPTAGEFLTRFGVVPVTLPWDDVADAVSRGDLDGIAWSGITEDYSVGWADVTNYFLTNSLSGAWCGSFFANTQSWEALPSHLQELFRVCMDSSHYYRLHWYWGGEARLRTQGDKLELTSIPDDEWRRVEEEAVAFWEEIAETSIRAARIVAVLKEYNETMVKAGRPYRYS